MTLNLGWGVTLIKCLFNISSVKFNLKQNHAPDIKFAEFCTAGGKWAYEKYLQKKLSFFC